MEFTNSISTFLWNLFNRPEFVDLIDIAIVAFLLYKIIMLTKETRAVQVLKGLVVLFVASYLSTLFGFTALNWLMQMVLSSGAVVLIVVFQPELRRMLEQVGIKTRLERSKDATSENQTIIQEIINCCMNLSRRRVGALIVFEQQTGLKDVMETGTGLDAVISGALLENIFEPNTPLHDGAVIIRNKRIVSAGCVLTLSEAGNLSRELGTRHRAAIGASETTDAVVLIVSEETGIVSLAKDGRLTRHLDNEALRAILSEMYEDSPSPIKHLLRTISQKKGERRARK